MARAEMRECGDKLTGITHTNIFPRFFVVAFKNESKMMACLPPISSLVDADSRPKMFL
jgi:hypothetical protein